MDLIKEKIYCLQKLAYFQEIMEPFQILMKRFRFILRKFSKILAGFFVALPFLVLAMMVYKEPILNSSNGAVSKESISQPRNVQNSSLSTAEMSLLKFPSSRNQSSTASTRSVAKDKFLGRLISPGFHEESSCISRYTSYFYHKTSPHKPSNFLISKLRKYEKLHKLCGPNSKLYKETLERLHSQNNSTSTECKYVVWIAYSGLGNRILTIASAFLYALLTNRILLIEQKPDMVDLFCEPFPNTSWLLPMNFPFTKNFSSFDQEYENSHGNLLKKNVINSSSSKELKLSSLYLHLAHDYDDHDKLFFCDENQFLLREVPWLIMRTDNYFVPSLFLMQSFDQELIKLFPNKETVFHHLGRFLFHPSNQVWGLITRYYQAYLSKADEKIGLQIRVIDTVKSPFQSVMDQILACTKKENLLPEIEPEKTGFSSHGNQKISKAVLITSLYSGYFEKIKNKYWTHPTVNGEVVGVYQPSNEKQQKFENNMHNMKAWAEINLLSMCDVLVTSGWSTFGYVAQGLGGLRPWILYKIENQSAAPDPPCGRVMSMEPCFHSPPIYHCKTKKYVDNGALVPHVRHCEDMSWGLKLFSQ